MRLDIYLTEKKFTETRSRAKNMIELGRVSVNGTIIKKPAYEIIEGDVIELGNDYSASLGSIKLEKAIEVFNPDINNKVCLDLGASNGGFCDILLKNDAKVVYALDIAECALPERLKNDKRIKIKDKTNARYIKKEDFEDKIDFITGDLSFISLKYIIPPAYEILGKGECIFLIKPQFETDRQSLTKKGIVKNKKTELKAVNDIKEFATQAGFTVKNIIEAPHPFEDKNQEYLIYLCK